MSLDASAVDLVLDRWLDTFRPALSPAARAQVKASQMRGLVEAFFSVLKERAVVTPNTMTAGGDPVAGTGKIT